MHSYELQKVQRHIEEAQDMGRKVYTALTVECSVLNDTELGRLRSANARAKAAHTILRVVKEENATDLNWTTAPKLLNRLRVIQREYIRKGTDNETLQVMDDYIVYLEEYERASEELQSILKAGGYEVEHP